MIACDSCDEWFHGDCVGVTEQEGLAMDTIIVPSWQTVL